MWQIKTQALCIQFAGGGGWEFYRTLAPERDGRSRAHAEMHSR